MRCAPEETRQNDYRCPSCGKRLTVGVMHRVEKLADREHGFRPAGAPPYHSLIPLQELLAEARGVGTNSKSVRDDYMNLLAKLGNEFKILMDVSPGDIERAASPLVAEAVARMRSGKVHINPGYDGEYGEITIFGDAERKEIKGQMRLL
jgi:PHP family Zn ribbon phosphoesterase